MATEPTVVVTAFLRNRGDVLLVRRSDAVGSYRGLWGGVSGYVEPGDGGPADPEATARREIDEETGLADACQLVRRGEPFVVEDREPEGARDGAGDGEPEGGRDGAGDGEPGGDGYTWQVHPFLFDCSAREVDPNEEVAAYAWVAPTEMLRRETVPALWTSYDHVRPTVGTIRADGVHGSSYLSLRALEVLRDRAGELAAAGEARDASADATRPSAGDAVGDAGDGPDGEPPTDEAAWDELAALAVELVEARPGMAALRNRVDRAMATAGDRTPAAVEASARSASRRALEADADAAAGAAERVAGERVLTLSRSGTVTRALQEAPVDGVVAAESRPGREGVGVAETLATGGRAVTLIADAAVAGHLAAGEVDVVLVGADTVLPDGSVVNKVGTRAAALAAAREGVPFHAATARDKVAPTGEFHQEAGDPAEVYDGEADVAVESPLFDVTPPDLVDAVLTEDGPLAPEDVGAVAEEHRDLADWR